MGRACSGWLRGRRRFYGEFPGADDRFISEQVDGCDFDVVATGNERRHGDEALEGDLLPASMKMTGGFDSASNFLLIFGDAIDDGDVGLVRSLVQIEVVKLQEDAQLVRARKFLTEARADFVGVEDELAGSDLRGRGGLDLVGKNQGTGVELVDLKVRDTQGGIEQAEVAAQRVFDD